MTTQTSIKTIPSKAMFICLILAWICFLLPIIFLGLLGWALNLSVFILAIVCLVRGGIAKGILGIILSTLGTLIIYFIGLAIFGAVLSHHHGTNHETIDTTVITTTYKSGK